MFVRVETSATILHNGMEILASVALPNVWTSRLLAKEATIKGFATRSALKMQQACARALATDRGVN